MKTSEEIDRIVQEVVRRLVRLPSDSTPASDSVAEPGVLHLNDRVVTLQTIEKKLDGIQQVVVPTRAVVTPSVYDELRTQNIRLTRHDTDNQTSTYRKLLIANLATGHSLALHGLSCDFQTVPQGTLQATIGFFATHLKNHSIGVMVTDQPEWAVCLANRNSNLKAFVGHNIESTRRAKRHALNLMAIHAKSNSARQLVESFTG